MSTDVHVAVGVNSHPYTTAKFSRLLRGDGKRFSVVMTLEGPGKPSLSPVVVDIDAADFVDAFMAVVPRWYWLAKDERV